MGAARWIEYDTEMVMKHYPNGGSKEVQKHLRNKHSLTSIQGKAKRLGVKRGQSYERQELTKNLLKEIKKAYAKGKRGALKQLAEKQGVDYQWLKHLANTHGISHTKYYRWSKEADQIIKENEGFCTHTIRTRLTQAGYYYPVSAIAKRMSQMRITLRADDEYNIQEISDIFGIETRRIRGFIERGLLRTRTHITADGSVSEKQYLNTKHLRQFIQENPCEFDLRKIEPAFHVWFIDLLTNRTAEQVGQ